MGRQTCTELTKVSNGNYLMVTWEWSNGWNLIDARPATEEEKKKGGVR